uniref:hypothetical protein n=1 Tax=Psammodictyon constrictum TaxID=515483 RepID=UPI001EF9D58C|nr:hypothetical protein MKU01_pgp032 [Psammodictyon constrictum]ULD16461.1 hypothetical protein [Psammodictyon constrictum]
MKKLTNTHFSDEKLDLDYLVFNLPRFRTQMLEVAEILHKYGFNSKSYDFETEEYSTILYDKTFTHSITFILENDCWNKDNLSIHFKASNSRRIYELIKRGIFSISQLNCSKFSVNRIDIQYVKSTTHYDSNYEVNLMKFYKESKQTFQTKFKGQPAFIDKFDKSIVLGDRRSSYFLRIYPLESNSALKFELEIKKQTAQKLGLLLQRGYFTEFESMVSIKYFNHLKKSLSLKTDFTYWLLDSLRLKSPKPKTHLVSSYLKSYFLTETNFEELQFYRLLQFISFIRSYSPLGKQERLNDQLYITVQFKLVDFMKTLQVNINSYQRKQFLQFFDDLMGLPPYSQQFADRTFRKLLFFPVVNAIQETTNGPWYIQIAVAEPLMKNYYPFHFPPSFFVYTSTINLQVKLSIIRSFGQEPSSKKTYLIQSFRNKYKKRSNSIQAQVKQEILEQFKELLKYKIIQPNFKILINSNNNNYFVNKPDIQLKDIQEAKVIYFYEIIYPI